MSDIVERLRECDRKLCAEAADEIERLRKLDAYELGYTEGERSGQVNAELKYETEIERLREALETCRELKESYHEELIALRSENEILAANQYGS